MIIFCTNELSLLVKLNLKSETIYSNNNLKCFLSRQAVNVDCQFLSCGSCWVYGWFCWYFDGWCMLLQVSLLLCLYFLPYLLLDKYFVPVQNLSHIWSQWFLKFYYMLKGLSKLLFFYILNCSTV